MRQVLGGFSLLRWMGESRVAFLCCHLESKPPTSVPIAVPGAAGSHPMGFSDCFGIPTGALIPDQAASAMMVLSLPVQQRKNPPLWCTQTQDSLLLREYYNWLHKITFVLWPQQLSNRKFHGKFWKFLVFWRVQEKNVFNVYFSRAFWELECCGLTALSTFVLFCYCTSQNEWCLDNFHFSI